MTDEVVEVVAAVIERDGKLLITRRRAGAHLGGLWDFRGGKADPGEPATRALEREILEELGVTIRVGEPLATVDWAYPDKRVRIRFFRCVAQGEPRPLEGQELAWVAPDDLGRHRFPAADAELIKRLGGGSAA